MNNNTTPISYTTNVPYVGATISKGTKKRKCAFCKKEMNKVCTNEWAYKRKEKFYCSWKCMRLADKKDENKKRKHSRAEPGNATRNYSEYYARMKKLAESGEMLTCKYCGDTKNAGEFITRIMCRTCKNQRHKEARNRRRQNAEH